ncbi:Proline iminopeptidase [Massilia sp. Bi118]|uniref:alpha/beta fold hydrolase n=1 Tax=Massilia sp. Bi118 TaxID=2822346 RepID=UPI001DB36C4F|nr:alpha/beta hydrolase [Massilia sp. Bi118]CAH0246327.1 Proline iminopeptidase [Massilia sp. Bi118]
MPRHLLAALPFLFIQLPAQAQAPAFGLLPDSVCTTANNAVDEKGFVRIGGMEQWVRIKGSSCANPVLVLVHGGPGNPTTPWADNVYKAWEKDFTIVQWDQRGAGMTYSRNPPAEDTPLVLEQLRDDGVEVARYAARRFGKRKVILMGGSWSSVLGMHMAKSNPAMFCGYVSTAQVVGNALSQRASYDATLALARAAGDVDSIGKLEGIGPPPWTNPRNPGIIRRIMRKYEAMSTAPAPKSWWTMSPEYATAKYDADYTAGEDYSWLQFVGLKGDGIASKIDLYKLGPKFEVPIYMLQGEQDLLTMPAPSRRYFDFIQAPRKEYVLVPRAGHDPNPPMVDAQYAMLKKIGDCR